MNYLIFSDAASAATRNHAMALAQGAGGPSDTTQYWWASQDHPTDGRCALSIPDVDQSLLSPSEAAALVAALSSDWTVAPVRG
jgi:hypothetical protein